MKLPWIRRSTHEAELRAAAAGEAAAIKEARRAELALHNAFGLTVEDLFHDSAILEVRLQVHKRVINQYRGGREAMAQDVARRLVYDLYPVKNRQ